MKSSAVFGTGIGINGREAAARAAQSALDQMGAERPVLALVFAAQEFDLPEVTAAISGLLGGVPLWGFSTTRPITAQGDLPRSVVVALVTGGGLKASVEWQPDYARHSEQSAAALAHRLVEEVFLPQAVLLAADGFSGSLEPYCQALSEQPVAVCGGMAAGEPALGQTWQIGGSRAAAGGLAAALLSGSFRVGLGLGHGWQDLGLYFRVTGARDLHVLSLDRQPAAEAYARCFGFSAGEWSQPPLAEMARLYPLGVEIPSGETVSPFIETDPSGLLVRSAVRMEPDGSLRMSAAVPEGVVAHLMTGDPDACLRAAESAARQALASLEDARPLLAVALVDAAWQALFETRPSAVAAAVKSVTGSLPLVGAYTFGQVHSSLPNPPILHNQNIQVIVLAEAQSL